MLRTSRHGNRVSARPPGGPAMSSRRQSLAAPPITRRERRAQERAERASRHSPRHRSKAQRPPWWRSPMVVFTAAALTIGLAVVGYATFSRPAAPTDEIIAPRVTIPEDLADGNALGSVDTPVTVEIWSDFQCPGCRQLAIAVEPALIGQYVVPGAARLVYRDAAFQGQRAGR